MKRHAALVPLSRQHHDTLILAQVIKKGAPDYRGMPTTIEGKKEAVVNHFHSHLINRFKIEEELFAKLKNRFPGIDELIAQLIQEHRRIESLIGEISNHASPDEKLNELGLLFESHIRKEEWQLFELIPQKFEDSFLDSL